MRTRATAAIARAGHRRRQLSVAVSLIFVLAGLAVPATRASDQTVAAAVISAQSEVVNADGRVMRTLARLVGLPARELSIGRAVRVIDPAHTRRAALRPTLRSVHLAGRATRRAQLRLQEETGESPAALVARDRALAANGSRRSGGGGRPVVL